MVPKILVPLDKWSLTNFVPVFLDPHSLSPYCPSGQKEYLSRKTKLVGDHLSLGTEFLGTICPCGLNRLGTVCPDGPINWGPINWGPCAFGTTCVTAISLSIKIPHLFYKKMIPLCPAMHIRAEFPSGRYYLNTCFALFLVLLNASAKYRPTYVGFIGV